MRNKIVDAFDAYSWQTLPALPGRTNTIKCGVLVPLILGPAPTCYVGMRAKNLKSHAGEICFPGGQQEAGDATLEDTAKRESQEEMGIRDVEIIGRLSSMPLYTSDYRLEPFVGVIESAPHEPDGAEIVEIVEVSIRDILGQETISSLSWVHKDRKRLLPIFAVGSHLMYGATAFVFFEFLQVLAPPLGLSVPPLAEGPYCWDDIL